MAVSDIYFAEEANPKEIAHRIAKLGHIGLLEWGDPEHNIFVLVGNAHNPQVIKRMNKVKRRPEDQVLAIAGGADVIERVVDSDKLKALSKVAQKSGLH